MDKNAIQLLNYIYSRVKDDSYKVIEISEMLKAFSKRKKLKPEELARCLKELEKDGFINIKYSDKEVYCLAITKKTLTKTNQKSDFEKEISKLKRLFLLYSLLSLSLGFMGAAIAVWIFT